MIRMLLFLLLCLPALAKDDALRQAIRSDHGQTYPYYTLVPYKQTAFAAAYDVNAQTRNSTGKATHWVIYEYAGGSWRQVFAFQSTADADEESERLDGIFRKYQFSSEMRGKLMYGEENRL